MACQRARSSMTLRAEEQAPGRAMARDPSRAKMDGLLGRYRPSSNHDPHRIRETSQAPLGASLVRQEKIGLQEGDPKGLAFFSCDLAGYVPPAALTTTPGPHGATARQRQ